MKKLKKLKGGNHADPIPLGEPLSGFFTHLKFQCASPGEEPTWRCKWRVGGPPIGSTHLKLQILRINWCNIIEQRVHLLFGQRYST